MQYRFLVQTEVIIEASNPDQAQEKFMELDLGDLNGELRGKNIKLWEYMDTESIHIVNKDGCLGDKIS